jgi:hypothetical protein
MECAYLIKHTADTGADGTVVAPRATPMTMSTAFSSSQPSTAHVAPSASYTMMRNNTVHPAPASAWFGSAPKREF